MLGRTIAAVVTVGLIGVAAAQDIDMPVISNSQTRPGDAAATAKAFYMIQVGAGRTEVHARRALRALREQYPGILGRLPMRVERADLSTRGIWYRMQLGAFPSAVEANRLCRDLARAGHRDCLAIQRHIPVDDAPSARPRDHEA